MRQSARELFGYRVHATDGIVGRVEDLLFEDQSWRVRHLVVTVGSWLQGDQRLLAPDSLSGVDRRARAIHVPLSGAAVRGSLDVASARRVPRTEAVTLALYGWQLYCPGFISYETYPPLLLTELDQVLARTVATSCAVCAK